VQENLGQIQQNGQTNVRNLSTSAVTARIYGNLWRRPWKNYRVISGHLGCVRSVAFDPSNEWFCTGSADQTIKIWDVGTGNLKLTLTGHIGQVRGVSVSKKQTYLFAAGDDKKVNCWDLEQNKVIRSYHGHLSGVYCLALHLTLDILLTGGRDSVCRVWDIRTKKQVHALRHYLMKTPFVRFSPEEQIRKLSPVHMTQQ
jgi:pleiotropic regulator 1